MIHVLDLNVPSSPRVWFAYDAEDLLRKLASLDLDALRAAHARGAHDDPYELACDTLRARGACRIFPSDAAATAAFEDARDPAWQGPGWRARIALREQLVALDVLADDL